MSNTLKTGSININPQLIKVSWSDNSRIDYGEHDGSFSDLKASIKSTGMYHPVDVVRLASGTYKLKEGYRRMKAVLELLKEGHQIPVVPARTFSDESSRTELLKDRITSNSGKPLNQIELGGIFAELKQAMTQGEIARQMGLSDGHVSQCLKLFNELPPTLKHKVGTGQISASAALQCLRSGGEVLVVAEKVCNAGSTITAADAGCNQRHIPLFRKAIVEIETYNLSASKSSKAKAFLSDLQNAISSKNPAALAEFVKTHI